MRNGRGFPWRRLDARILGVLGVMSVLSLLFIGSAGFDPATGKYVPLWRKQIVWMLLSAGTLVLLLRVPYRRILDHAWFLFFGGVALLLLVKVGGTVVNGSRRWLDVGFMYLQPSEFMKVVLIVALARLIRWKDDYKRLRGLVMPFAVTLLPMALILLQPDLGTAILFVPILFVLLWVAGARAKHLGLVVLMGCAATPVLYMTMLKEYQQRRIDVFLGQRSVSDEEARNHAYHLTRSKIAVGSGGPLGKGLGDGEQLVPYNESDFLFTVIAEEWGFLGSLLVLVLYALLLLFVADVAVTTTEPSGKLIVAGVFTLILVQVSVNIGMTVGLAPITGLTLPFLSYGGSSLLSMSLAIGLVLNVRLHPDFVFKRDL